MPLPALRQFFRMESIGGLSLMGAALLALILANSPLAVHYFALIDLPVAVSIGEFALDKPLLLWVNDLLMAVFFLLVGLEIKREVLEGQLSSRDQILLPALGAIGGFALPALIYAGLNWGNPDTLRGWAVPSATDIAFALGILALLGSRVPLAIKVFLTTVAVIDDLAAIVVIALFYSNELSATALLGAGLGLAALIGLNRLGVTRMAPYLLIGLAIWLFVLKSGVHATLAGVLVALTIPLRRLNTEGQSPARHLEHALHPYVAFAILPLFAFVNAGVDLPQFGLGHLLDPVPLGIILGLFVGKQVGVFAMVWMAIKLGWARMPDGANWASLYGVSILTGIGFTMSLFIGTLAFSGPEYAAALRIGVLVGSIASGVLGYLVLRAALRDPARVPRAGEQCLGQA